MLISIFMKLFHILSLHFKTADVKSHFLYAFVNREKIFSENKTKWDLNALQFLSRQR